MKTIIVEDNPMAMLALEQYCHGNDKIELVNTLTNGTDALSYLETEKIDLMFLDIEMPDMTGIQLLDKIPYFPQVAVTTSNKDYAYAAYEYDVVDFLKKPIALPRFQKAVDRAEKNWNKTNSIASSSAKKELYVKSDGRLTRVPFDSILYFENVGDYIKIITNSGNHVIYGALKTLAEKLGHPRFLKIHRSYIVNLDKIIDIEDNSLVIGQKVIPISRAHKPILLNSINII